MIPKKIHYCWFSGKKIPKEYMDYLESWKKFCPDYEIIQWDESNYDITKNQYMYSAYQERRWGFVPDYARLDILYNEGGFYLDTDVELLKSLDQLCQEKSFLGFEENHAINPGCGCGAEKGNPIIRELRDMYDSLSFYTEDGNLNLTPSPGYISAKLEELGVLRNNRLQRLENITIYPKEYFGAKEYTSGREYRTANTYSIHHYSSSWMSEEEKELEKRRKERCNRYGHFIGNRINGLCLRLDKLKPVKIYQLRQLLLEHFIYSEKKNEKRLSRFLQREVKPLEKPETVVMLSPACHSPNIGDIIIETCCDEVLGEMGMIAKEKITTHKHPSNNEQKHLKEASIAIVAGSNLLSANLHHCQWKLPNDYQSLEDICLMGCGWSNYNEQINDFSRQFYKEILGNQWLHSVRDRYTEDKLKSIGLQNVIYTGCPTMWTLTPKHCRNIKTQKAKTVVTALTSYSPDETLDYAQLQKLFDLYEKVYFWPQGIEDEAYLQRLLSIEEMNRIVVLERKIIALNHVFLAEQADYVGNRLHAGIYALRKGCRSLVIAIDNRATEIGKDTNLPVIQRNKVLEELEEKITCDQQIFIDLPWDNIETWKAQFVERKTNGGQRKS